MKKFHDRYVIKEKNYFNKRMGVKKCQKVVKIKWIKMKKESFLNW